eukprot:6671050-Pyramimonas_sp.AAC.1
MSMNPVSPRLNLKTRRSWTLRRTMKRSIQTMSTIDLIGKKRAWKRQDRKLSLLYRSTRRLVHLLQTRGRHSGSTISS